MNRTVLSASLVSTALGAASLWLAVAPVTATLVLQPSSNPTHLTFTGYTGTGFAPAPAAGQLDSDTWRLNLGADGTMNFGDTQASGVYARGQAPFVANYGAVAFTNAQFGAASPIFGITPRNATWGTGLDTDQTLTLRLQNGASGLLTNLNLSYDVWVNNNGNNSNVIRFRHSPDDLTYLNEPTLNLFTPGANTGDGWVKTTLAINLPVNVAPNEFYYLQWGSRRDSAGSPQGYDSLGFDNILITGYFIPEPSTLLLLASGGWLLWRARRGKCGH